MFDDYDECPECGEEVEIEELETFDGMCEECYDAQNHLDSW